MKDFFYLEPYEAVLRLSTLCYLRTIRTCDTLEKLGSVKFAIYKTLGNPLSRYMLLLWPYIFLNPSFCPFTGKFHIKKIQFWTDSHWIYIGFNKRTIGILPESRCCFKNKSSNLVLLCVLSSNAKDRVIKWASLWSLAKQ